MLTVRECQERGSSVSQPPHVLCVPEVTSLQVCAIPYHTSPDSHPQPVPQQPSHLSPLATGSANPKPRPGRCQSGVGFSDPIPVSWTALPGSEQGFSSSFGTSTAQLSSAQEICPAHREGRCLGELEQPQTPPCPGTAGLSGQPALCAPVSPHRA